MKIRFPLPIILTASLSFGEIPLKTDPEGASVFVDGRLVGNTSERIQLSDDDWQREVLVHKNDFQALAVKKTDAAGIIRLSPYPRTTSTGIPLVDVPILDNTNKPLYTVQFAIWETRTKDFDEFAEYVQNHPSEFPSKFVQNETAPDYRKHRINVYEKEQATPDHPVVCISKQTVRAFCEWLTETDRSKGIIPENLSYRLPSDLEWSSAAQVQEDRNPDLSPFAREKTAILPDICKYDAYPKHPLGNLKGSEYDRYKISHTGILKVDDGHVKTSPVGRFAPNRFGIFDLLGNVYESCLDLKYSDEEAHERWMVDSYVDRGPCYDRFFPNLAARFGWIGEEVGFRLVLAPKDIWPYGYHGERPIKPYSERTKEQQTASPQE